MISMFTRTAVSLRSTLESMATPCSVKAWTGNAGRRGFQGTLRSQFVTSNRKLLADNEET